MPAIAPGSQPPPAALKKPRGASRIRSVAVQPEAANCGYGWAKRMLEQKAMILARETGLRLTIVRPFNIYGERYTWAGEASRAPA